MPLANAAMLTLKSRKCCAYGLDAAVEGFHVLLRSSFDSGSANPVCH